MMRILLSQMRLLKTYRAGPVDQGFFPLQDDPNFDAWRVGGVGH